MHFKVNDSHCLHREKTDATIVENHVKIIGSVPDGDSLCSSWVGKKLTEGKEQTLNLDISACMKYSTFVHEFLHAYGLEHEQSRPDRDDFITVAFNNIRKKGWIQYKICQGCKTYGVPYDGRSIMHYPSGSFALDFSKPTMISKVKFSSSPLNI